MNRPADGQTHWAGERQRVRERARERARESWQDKGGHWGVQLQSSCSRQKFLGLSHVCMRIIGLVKVISCCLCQAGVSLCVCASGVWLTPIKLWNANQDNKQVHKTHTNFSAAAWKYAAYFCASHTTAERYETARGVAHKQNDSNGNKMATKAVADSAKSSHPRTCVCVCVYMWERDRGGGVGKSLAYCGFSDHFRTLTFACACPWLSLQPFPQLTVHKLSAHHTLIGHIHTATHTHSRTQTHPILNGDF